MTGSIKTEFAPGEPRIAFDHCGSGPAVVFLHAIGGNRTNWRDQLLAFGGSHHAIAIDMRGYGQSDDYEGPFRVEDVCGDIRRVLDALGHTKAHLVGLSIGGRLILDFYERYPDSVLSLVLCATFHKSGFMTPEEWKEFRDRRSERLLSGEEPADIADEVTRTLVRRDAPDAVRARVSASMAALHKHSYIKAIDGIHAYGRPADLAAIRVPALVVAGEHDKPSTPAYCEEMWRMIPGAEFYIVPAAAHMLNMEQPEYFNARVLEFLRGVPAERTAGSRS